MELICQIKDIYKALYSFEKEFAEKNQLTINEAMLLCCMKDEKPRSANEIAEFIGLSNPRVSKIITTVEQKGWIVRSMGEEDRRKMIFSLSKEGKIKIKSMKSTKITLNKVLSQLIENE
jgi:Transcriptional regulators